MRQQLGFAERVCGHPFRAGLVAATAAGLAVAAALRRAGPERAVVLDGPDQYRRRLQVFTDKAVGPAVAVFLPEAACRMYVGALASEERRAPVETVWRGHPQPLMLSAALWQLVQAGVARRSPYDEKLGHSYWPAPALDWLVTATNQEVSDLKEPLLLVRESIRDDLIARGLSVGGLYDRPRNPDPALA
ncbi:MAG TPA: hypothetical protein VLE99_03970 [Candidatus Saccharimonadales bacterium]|nr:hypothetical protein [Candidatus Saccharimonadales bacterium]